MGCLDGIKDYLVLLYLSGGNSWACLVSDCELKYLFE